MNLPRIATVWTVWAFTPDDGSPRQAHCIPDDDLYDHSFDDCTCHPEIGDDGEYIHNSFDGREAFETGERKVS